MLKWIYKIRIGFLHASYHRNMRLAEKARVEKNIIDFKKYIYQAEDAWKRIVILIEKTK